MKWFVNILFLLFSWFSMNAQPVKVQSVCLSAEPRMYTIKGSKGMNFTWNVPSVGTVLNNEFKNDTIYITWQKTGNYTLSVTGDLNGCVVSKDILVNVTDGPLVSLGGDEYICEGREKWFTLPSGVYDSIRWSNDKRGTEYSSSKTETVKVKVYLNGCSAEDEANVTLINNPVLDLGRDTMAFCENQQIVLDANITGVDYIWKLKNTDANDSTLEYSKSVRLDKGNWIVSLTVTSANVCAAYDTMVLISCDIPFVEKNIPNFITPNKDGVNDTWVIPGISEYPNATIEIYDRWGRIVFRADKGYSKPWDGTMGSTDLPIDSYYYIINLNAKEGKNRVAKGTIVIIK